MVLRLKDLFKRFTNHNPIIGLILLSLCAKLFLLGIDQVINPDGASYIAAAQQLAAGNIHGSLQLYPMPAYPFLLALVHFVIPEWVLAARSIGIMALVLASFPLYGITRILFNRQAAFWATFCLALAPEANDQALSVLRDPVFLLIALTAIWYFIKGLREQNKKSIMMALVLTIASLLFRVEGIVLIVASAMFFTMKGIRSKDISLKMFCRRCLTLWIGAFILIVIIGSMILGPKLLSQNKRIAQLATEVNKVIHFKAFENYNEIYDFFKTIENEPPFSGKSKSLPGIVRHWMPLIYFIGILEYFVKQLFPIFLIPLLWTVFHYFYHRLQQTIVEKQYICIVWVVYILLILYTFMVRDSMQGRFLFTPAVLLYPWVGHGIVLVFQWLKDIRFSQILRVAVLLLFTVTPCVEIAKAVVKSDRGALEVGRFISKDATLFDAKMVFSDTRQWLYGQRREAFPSIHYMARTISNHIVKGQMKAIENLAINENIDALVLFINFNKTKTIPEFDYYMVYKQFPSRKGITIIYSRINPE